MDFKKNSRTIINAAIILAVISGIGWGLRYYSHHQKKTAPIHASPLPASTPEKRLLPLDIEAHRLAADYYRSSEKPAKALPHYERILRYQADDRVLHYQYACACLDAKRYEKALEIFYELENVKDSLSDKIAARTGITLFYLKRPSESKKLLTETLAKSPDCAEALCFLGQIEAAEPATEKHGALLLKKAVEADPSYNEGWYQLARYSMQRQKYTEAKQQLLQALQIDPLNGHCHSRLGMAYYYLGNIELARKSYQTALAIDPADGNTHYNLGELYYTSMNDPELALREYTAALKQDPEHGESNFKVGVICLRNNMVKEAISYFRTALKKSPQNVSVLLQLGVAYEKLGDRALALKVYKKIITIDELNSIALQKVKYLSQE